VEQLTEHPVLQLVEQLTEHPVLQAVERSYCIGLAVLLNASPIVARDALPFMSPEVE